MIDQSKPTTGKRKSCDCDDPSVPHYPEDHLITPKPTTSVKDWTVRMGDESQPKPTGEWTVEENDYGTTLNLHDGSGPVSLPIGRPWFVFATIIADAHNASITAEREKYRKEMEAVTMNTSDIETVQQLREQLADDVGRRDEWYETLCGDLQRQLVAERERADHNADVADSIGDQLAAEREKVQTFIDALKDIRVGAPDIVKQQIKDALEKGK